MDQTRAGIVHTKAPTDKIFIALPDREKLRTLAAKVATLAARPIEAQKRDLWLRHNALQPTRPVIFCDPENGWNEIILHKDLKCEGELARRWEMRLRKEIFWGESLRDDRVIPSTFDVAHVYTDTGWGLSETRTDGGHGGAYAWESPLKDYDRDFGRLRFPQITVDYAATDRLAGLAHGTLGDLLPIRIKTSWWWTLGMTWTASNLRGLEQIMYDMLDRPDDLHRLMAFLRDGNLAKLDFLEREGLLADNTDGTYVGSGGFGWNKSLERATPAEPVRTRDMWGFAESQETVGVSPAAFAEFIFPYQLPILKRFGLACYGCCEPLDKRWDVVKKIPNLRRVSVSPWSNTATMAERLGSQYVFSWKPTPTNLAMDRFDEDTIRAQLRTVFAQTRNCRVEAIMKDNHTIKDDPRRVVRWVEIAREESERL
ncbi:MAG TPA: hypothetical protein VL860_01675 [Planctomycetota bacterium]|nr:hypothetical protein [Planctomycetota bacterium]